MIAKINGSAYMDVSAAAQNQSIQPTQGEECNRPDIASNPNHTGKTGEAKAHEIASPGGALRDAGRSNFLSSEEAAPVDFTKEGLQEAIERIREANKAGSKTNNILAKCMRIAMRIVQGDNVPPRDDKFLAEHNPELHMRAWMLRVIKEDPEDHESELDDEDGDSLDQMLADIIGSSLSGDGHSDIDISMPEIVF